MKMKKIILENKNCLFSCKQNDELILEASDLLFKKEGVFSIYKCKECNLIRTNPRPILEQMRYYYPNEYGPFESTDIKNNLRRENLKAIEYIKYVKDYLFNTKDQDIPKIPPGNLLEIGCASGSFMKKMEQKGWKVEGIESSTYAGMKAKLNGLKVHIGNLEEAPKSKNKYHLIVGWMVIEHLHDPKSSLKKLNNWATDDGWLAISVPNVDSIDFKIFKQHWYALQVPTHLYHYSPRTITVLLEECGWSVKKIFHQRSSSNLLMSFSLYLYSIKCFNLSSLFKKINEATGIWFYLKFPLGFLLGATKQSGRITVWAKRKNGN